MAEAKGISKGLLGELIELGELARLLGQEEKTLRNRIYQGKFPRGQKLPGTRGRFYRRHEIEAWLAKNLEEA